MVRNQGLLKDEVAIIIASISWNMEWQGHHKLTFWWARHAKKVIYVNNMPKRLPKLREISRVPPRIDPRRNRYPRFLKHLQPLKKFQNVDIITPLVLPSVNSLFNWINRQFYIKKLAGEIEKRIQGRRPLVWCLLPSRSAETLIEYLKPRLFVYNCVDNYQAGRDAARDVADVENRFIKKADIVAVTSDYLYQQKSKIRKDIHIVSEGVDFGLFQEANTGFFNGSVKRVCYFGGVNRQRINIDIINALGAAGIEVWIVGTVRDSLPRLDSNVRLKPAVEHERLPGLLAKCDCLILPYNINEFTDGIMPAKMFECFATGKPVVSTPLSNLKEFKDVIILADTVEDFVESVKNAGRLDTMEKYEKRLSMAETRIEEHEYDSFIQPILDLISK